MMMKAGFLPFLTSDLEGVGGRIKQFLGDFCVDEIPLYEPSGEGTHLYFRVVKEGVATPVVVERIARHMGVNRSEIGFAGLKDARAVTSQMMSLEHADERKLLGYSDRQVQIEPLGLHGNKLRAGHLAGNRFGIRIRDVDPASIDAAGAILEELERRGAPNYFGLQRFGSRGDTDKLGEALVAGDLDGFLALYLGRACDADSPPCRAARDAFDVGHLDRALKLWPRHCSNERRAMSAYKKKRRAVSAIAAIDKRMKRLFVSALQSAVFNDVLARRIESRDKVEEGDLACKGDNGPVFTVEDAAVEQPRADTFEISPTGPIPGYRTSLAAGAPGHVEREALARRNLELETFRNLGPLKAKGTRRSLRFRITEADLSAGSDDRGDFMRLIFTAPSGAYATIVLREIMKLEV